MCPVAMVAALRRAREPHQVDQAGCRRGKARSHEDSTGWSTRGAGGTPATASTLPGAGAEAGDVRLPRRWMCASCVSNLEGWDRGRPPGGRSPGGRPPGGGALTATDATCMKSRSRRARGREVDRGIIVTADRQRGQVRPSFSLSRSASPRLSRLCGRASW